MATTKNKNLFYQLYSKDNSIANSGYVCQSAINENETSFDISGSEALITDSNGDILASLDLSKIHAAGITLYNVETKLLQPHSAYLLQGNEYGETYKSLFFLIHKSLCNVYEYQDYCNLQFDLLYKQKGKINNVQVTTKKIRETYGSFTILALNQLNKLLVPISISIKVFDDENSSCAKLEYINFQSTEEGYDFIIRNVILTPILNSESTDMEKDGEFYDSPFTEPNLTQDLILDILDEIQPNKVGLHNTDLNTYKIGCDIYRALMKLSLDVFSDFQLFSYEIDILKKYFLPCFNEITGELEYEDKFKAVINKYHTVYVHYFSNLLDTYNIHDIVKVLEKILEYIYSVKSTIGKYYCFEDISRRVNCVKYPNGACRGIVLVPNWPNNEDYESNVLLINHVADLIEICLPINNDLLKNYYGCDIYHNKHAQLYEKALATVKINALIPNEKQQYIEDINNLPLNDISSNDGFSTSFDNLYVAGYDEHKFINNKFHRLPLTQDKTNWSEPIKYHNDEMYIENNTDNNDLWTNTSNTNGMRYVDTHENISNKFIGLYKYMEYLSANDIWIRCGDAYMILAKDDNYEIKTKNLLSSLLVYNPNDIPIRIKYIVFS